MKRLVQVVAGVTVIALVTSAWESRQDVDDTHDLELELFELEQRQKMIDREILTIGVSLARANDTWRELAATALVPRQQQGAPWGRGPPPDSYFHKECAAPRWPAAGEHRYALSSHDACARSKVSWRLEPQCPGADGDATTRPRLRRQVLVTGVQRSGTHFTWEFFNRLGVHVHHEGLGPAGSVSWLYSWRAANFAINNPQPLTGAHRFCVVLHQVRHPLRVIASIVKATKPRDKYWAWIATVEPDIDNSRPPSIRAAHLWLLQNLRIEQYADARFKVEETSPRDVCRMAGFDEVLCGADGSYHTTSSPRVQPIIDLKPIPRDIIEANLNTYKHPNAHWEDLEAQDAALTKQVQDMATRYGYNLDPRYHPQSLASEDFKA